MHLARAVGFVDDLLRSGFYTNLAPHPLPSRYYHNTKSLLNPTFHTQADPAESKPKLCKIRHPYHPYLIPELPVIDLTNNCLIIPEASVRYVTLSYTWGRAQSLTSSKSNFEELHASDGLGRHTKELPRTIVDAIKLTLKLRECFLWIDALCITQDDASDQKTQFMRMDHIYQNSILTIVACTGADADSGMPGVHPGTRFPAQHTTEIHGQRLISHDIEKWRKEVSLSVWDKRAWTYQEIICSNRLLIVGKSQMHFNCTDNCVFSEEIAVDVGFEEHPVSEVPSPRTTNYFPRANWTTLMHSFQAYVSVVSDYTTGTISNLGDIRFAVVSTVNRWQSFFGHWSHICGLPPGVMGIGLPWHCTGSYRRRRDLRTGHTGRAGVGWRGKARSSIPDLECLKTRFYR
jgi:Heterokaryon incompatibility protein (HET)